MENQILILILVLVILTSLVSTYKKKFFNECDHKLDPIVVAFVIDLIMALILGLLCMFRENTKSELIYIFNHKNNNYLIYAILLTVITTITYYYILSRVKLSKMSLVRSCLSIIVGVITSQYLLGEEINNSTKMGVFLLLVSLYLINNQNAVD